MKRILIVFSVLFFSLAGVAQEKLYNPNADPQKDVTKALVEAKQQGKHVLLQIGGNWCPWCIKLHNYMHETAQVKQLLDDAYIVVKVNYSKENKNLSYLEYLEYPQRFGFPVLVILNSNGKRLHTQDSGLLESGNGYDSKKIETFLKNWSPQSFKAENYK
ncbi:MAG: thioredoxin family protein [Bacteroidales bacterium]|nr:thioredoxin family protein [Bacteroidales bacterium]MBN2749174.1 thioredoxin family protein [Bacteroidales bacterium]